METVIGEGKSGAWADSSRCWKHVYVLWTCKSCSSCCASTQMWNRHLLLWVKFIDGKVGGCLWRTRWTVNFSVLLLLIFHKIFYFLTNYDYLVLHITVFPLGCDLWLPGFIQCPSSSLWCLQKTHLKPFLCIQGTISCTKREEGTSQITSQTMLLWFASLQQVSYLLCAAAPN